MKLSEISPVPAQRSTPKAVYLLFPLLVGGIFGGYLYIAAPTISSGCTQIVPDSAQINFFDNTTVAGFYVSYTNGTNSFYYAGVCPQPVHRALYDAVASVVSDSKFVAQENGSQFTVDPVNSLGAPLTAPNGSVYEALFFDRLNLSDTIYPCNLAGAFKQPLAEIEVLLPVRPNGSYIPENKTILYYPQNQLRPNCPPETGVVTFARSQIPHQFTVGGFNFTLAFTGQNYVATNGTSYAGQDYVFNVAYGNTTQAVVFNWPSSAALASNAEPTPFIALAMNSYVIVRWFGANSTLYVTITTGA